jgi:hypothetical protein
MMKPWNWKSGQSASDSQIEPEPKRDEDGRYIVHLPGKQSPIRLTPEDYDRYCQVKREAKR